MNATVTVIEVYYSFMIAKCMRVDKEMVWMNSSCEREALNVNMPFGMKKKI
jgi:hypothetical protein